MFTKAFLDCARSKQLDTLFVSDKFSKALSQLCNHL